MSLEPLNERAAEMEGHADVWKLFQDLQKWQVGTITSIMKYVVKISHRLVVMNSKYELDFFHSLQFPTKAA